MCLSATPADCSRPNKLRSQYDSVHHGAILMSTGREIRCFDYVNHPYEQVRDALTKDAPAVFHAATKAAAARAQSVASELRVNIAGIGVATDITISVNRIEEKISETAATPVTRLRLEWEAANLPGLFPFMQAEL